SLARVTVFDKLVGILVDGGPKETGIKDLFGSEVCTMMSPRGSIVASYENVESFFSVHTQPDYLIRTNLKQERVVPKIVFHVFEKLIFCWDVIPLTMKLPTEDERSILLKKVSHRSRDFGKILDESSNTSEPSNASTNVVNAPREPYVVKQDNGSFVDEIIFDLNRAPDSPNQFHCFHCKDVLRDGEACKRCTCAKCRSGLDKGLCYICGHNQNSLNDSPRISETPSQSPPNINHCFYECGDPLDGIFCKRCTCKSCGKDAHIGYNCPSKVPVISNPEPCNNQTIDELPRALPNFHPTFHSEVESPFTLDSTPTYVDESPNVFNPPPQPLVYPCEFCGNDAYFGHYCTPQTPFIYPEPCYNQDFNFTQNIQNVSQQYPCCDDCGVTHEPYQCQPMNHDYYHGQTFCYDSNSIAFDKCQTPQYTVNHPIFNAHNDLLISQTMLNEQMTQLTSMCEIFCQPVQKKQEKKRIEKEQAVKA
nr:hypothetical protein [Tanacetum cinerariifolium]